MIGASAGDYANSVTVRPRCAVLQQFDDNVAHSNFETGLQIDNFLTSDGNTQEGSLDPRTGPFDPSKTCSQSGTPQVFIEHNVGNKRERSRLILRDLYRIKIEDMECGENRV